MRPRISIRGSVRPSVVPLARLSVRPSVRRSVTLLFRIRDSSTSEEEGMSRGGRGRKEGVRGGAGGDEGGRGWGEYKCADRAVYPALFSSLHVFAFNYLILKSLLQKKFKDV